MQKQWILKTPESVMDQETARKLSVHPVTAAILSARGMAAHDDAARFLEISLTGIADPFMIKGMRAAVDRLMVARSANEDICIYGDYDVDGISATSLLFSFLRGTGFRCRYFIPNRFEDGYGLNMKAVSEIIRQGASLIISVDCGITSVEEALYCRRNGSGLIIVDHHAPGETIPDAVAVLNPLQPDCSYPFKLLAGVGVAYNLLIALRSALRESGVFNGCKEPDLREWLDMVALGTIADVVPLTGQNRILAYHGIKRLSDASRPGIVALKEVSGVSGKVSCGQVGFRLAPRLNAAGRMESASPGVELLLSGCPEDARAIAADLDAANSERQGTEKRILDEAVRMIETSGKYPACRTIVLASRQWHQGVVGIVASRLVEMYNRPTVLLAIMADGSAKGSGRSIPGFHLLDALKRCKDFLDRSGGHRHAAGVGLAEKNITPFAECFEAVASGLLRDDDLVPRLNIDVQVEPDQVSTELALDLKRLEPFGAGNPEPMLMLDGMRVVGRRVVGEGHLRLKLARDGYAFDAIAFRMAELEAAGTVDIAFFPEINLWNGNSSLHLRIRDIRPSRL